ncbi:MAG: DsbA family protein [Dehalococcoidales bacterium]
MDSRLAVNWRYFSLEQANRRTGEGRKIWELPEDSPVPGLRAFRAAEAARCQGETAFNGFHMALLEEKHGRKSDIDDMKVIIRVAQRLGLEMDRFREDFSRRQSLDRLAEEHTFAVEKLGIFGTPTLVFPDGQAIFLKMSPPPSPEESLAVFRELSNLACHRSNILEIKRPPG